KHRKKYKNVQIVNVIRHKVRGNNQPLGGEVANVIVTSDCFVPREVAPVFLRKALGEFRLLANPLVPAPSIGESHHRRRLTTVASNDSRSNGFPIPPLPHHNQTSRSP